VPTYVNIVLPEGAWWHRTYLDTRAGDYVPAVRSRLEAGRAISAVDYLQARDSRLEWRRRVDAVLHDCDALVLPTLPIVAPPLGTTDVVIDPHGQSTVPVRAAMLRQTQLFNITGHPAVSLPIAAPGLPVGLQLVGRRSQTPRLASIAALCEQILER
jgi:aspartyl-tRNA(Asn)/glutamyl-tRNA(Gln) amidotransferase subunit A